MADEIEIPLSYNSIPHRTLASVLEYYENRNHNEIVRDFEKRICQYAKARLAVALNSGTAAIHLGLKALGVQTNDVVMASTFTYVASINPIRYLGAIPFFVDSCNDDWNIDPTLLEEGIKLCVKRGKKPKAILVVHTYGMPSRLDEIKKISTAYQIPVLEDAAEAIGSLYNGSQVGTFGDVGIFSFNNNKLLTNYGGGALVTNHQDIAANVDRWAGQSRDDLPFYEHREIGFNYKMSPLNAAMGLANIEVLDAAIAHRRNVFMLYQKHLNENLAWQKESPNVFSNRWMTAILLPEMIDPGKVQQRLSTKKIEARRMWKPMHLQPVFQGFESVTNGVAEKLFISGLCLPSGNGLTEAQVAEIAKTIQEF